MRRALITGITGMDGAYLSKFLLNHGYIVYGMHRRSATNKFGKLKFMGVLNHPNFILVEGDMTDTGSLQRLLHEYHPEEVYNLAAQSHVGSSFKLPEMTFDVVATGVIRLLEAIRQVDKDIKVYQASSSEMFGNAPAPQNELTPFRPRSPYAVAKCAAFNAVVNYRESYGIFGCNGILFNHEGELLGEEFVTRKITKAVAQIVVFREHADKLTLGSLDAMRDWGYAGEYVECMYRMMQKDKPGDYVIATGESYTVEHFVKESFACVGLDWREWVEIDPKFVRPCEVPELRGDAAKAEKELGWKATIRLPQLIKLMIDHDIAITEGKVTDG